jgi:hypothetical protein
MALEVPASPSVCVPLRSTPCLDVCLLPRVSLQQLATSFFPLPKVCCPVLGYYGTSQSEIFKEGSSPGRDYLSDVCQAWEQEAGKAAVDRLVILRTGQHYPWQLAVHNRSGNFPHLITQSAY